MTRRRLTRCCLLAAALLCPVLSQVPDIRCCGDFASNNNKCDPTASLTGIYGDGGYQQGGNVPDAADRTKTLAAYDRSLAIRIYNHYPNSRVKAKACADDTLRFTEDGDLSNYADIACTSWTALECTVTENRVDTTNVLIDPMLIVGGVSTPGEAVIWFDRTVTQYILFEYVDSKDPDHTSFDIFYPDMSQPSIKERFSFNFGWPKTVKLTPQPWPCWTTRLKNVIDHRGVDNRVHVETNDNIKFFNPDGPGGNTGLYETHHALKAETAIPYTEYAAGSGAHQITWSTVVPSVGKPANYVVRSAVEDESDGRITVELGCESGDATCSCAAAASCVFKGPEECQFWKPCVMQDKYTLSRGLGYVHSYKRPKDSFRIAIRDSATLDPLHPENFVHHMVPHPGCSANVESANWTTFNSFTGCGLKVTSVVDLAALSTDPPFDIWTGSEGGAAKYEASTWSGCSHHCHARCLGKGLLTAESAGSAGAGFTTEWNSGDCLTADCKGY